MAIVVYPATKAFMIGFVLVIKLGCQLEIDLNVIIADNKSIYYFARANHTDIYL
jgi:hypothetical protein